VRFELVRLDENARTTCALPIAPLPGDVLLLDHGVGMVGMFAVTRRVIDPKRGVVKVLVNAAGA
jgi:hypothetical protein